MLIIQIHNDGTGTNESANYEYRVHVNGDLVRLGLVKGHNRSRGWTALLELIIATERKQIKVPGCTCNAYQLENFGCKCGASRT